MSTAGTTGTICGQLAGPHYGEAMIPKTRREHLALNEFLRHFAGEFYRQAPQSKSLMVWGLQFVSQTGKY